MAPKPLEYEEDAPQTWRSHWLAFCGTCTPVDCISCLTAYCAPCVAYGWTTSRVFRTSFWKELAKYLLCFGLVGILNFFFEVARRTACALPSDHTQLDVLQEGRAVEPSAACAAMSGVTQLLLLLVSCGCSLIWAIYIGGPRRTQLRKALGIADRGAGGDCCCSGPGNGSVSDYCLHYCCLCCALAQEMRTVMHLQAADKLPQGCGPPEGYEPLLSKAPVFNGGMTRVEAAPLATMV